MFFLVKFEVAALVWKNLSASLPLTWKFLQCYVLLKHKKATLIWERRIPLVSAILEVYVLFIRPGDTKDAVSPIIWLGKRETENSGGREVSLAQTLRGSLCCSPGTFSLITWEHNPSNCLQPTSLSPFPHKDEDNNGIMQVPLLGKKLLRRDLAAAFLAYPDLLILPGILTHQRCDGG